MDHLWAYGSLIGFTTVSGGLWIIHESPMGLTHDSPIPWVSYGQPIDYSTGAWVARTGLPCKCFYWWPMGCPWESRGYSMDTREMPRAGSQSYPYNIPVMCSIAVFPPKISCSGPVRLRVLHPWSLASAHKNVVTGRFTRGKQLEPQRTRLQTVLQVPSV